VRLCGSLEKVKDVSRIERLDPPIGSLRLVNSWFVCYRVPGKKNHGVANQVDAIFHNWDAGFLTFDIWLYIMKFLYPYNFKHAWRLHWEKSYNGIHIFWEWILSQLKIIHWTYTCKQKSTITNTQTLWGHLWQIV